MVAWGFPWCAPRGLEPEELALSPKPEHLGSKGPKGSGKHARTGGRPRQRPNKGDGKVDGRWKRGNGQRLRPGEGVKEIRMTAGLGFGIRLGTASRSDVMGCGSGMGK